MKNSPKSRDSSVGRFDLPVLSTIPALAGKTKEVTNNGSAYKDIPDAKRSG